MKSTPMQRIRVLSGQYRQRLSLLIPFFLFILFAFLVTATIVAVIIALLINQGTLQAGDVELNIGTFVLNLLLWSLIIGSVLTAISTHIILKPVNKILNALNRLASGDYSARLSFRGVFSRNRTIAELTDSFNSMASELEQTEMLRSDFINNFSHEFKTPIVSIAGFAKLLKRGNLPEEEIREYLDVIEEESMRLSQMATNVLNLTTVENQSILTDLNRFNLSEQLRTCVLMLEHKWEKKKIDLSLPMEEFYLEGNEELLKEVWINLFDNAIKFSPEYGLVEAAIHQDSSGTTVIISNFGDPIPQESMDKIFRKFYQADESHASEGNGVGLAIVKKIIDLHHGRVHAECRDGKTSFFVMIPAAV